MKPYEKPEAEKVEFSYQEQIVAASGYLCRYEYNLDQYSDTCEVVGIPVPNV